MKLRDKIIEEIIVADKNSPLQALSGNRNFLFAAVAGAALMISAPAFAQGAAPPPEAFPPYAPDWSSGCWPQKLMTGNLCGCWQVQWTHKAPRGAQQSRHVHRTSARSASKGRSVISLSKNP
jgi:hypothetical protein